MHCPRLKQTHTFYWVAKDLLKYIVAKYAINIDELNDEYMHNHDNTMLSLAEVVLHYRKIAEVVSHYRSSVNLC